MSEIYEHMSENFVIPAFVTNVADYENVDISIVGRLVSGLDFMKSINCSPYILDVIENGYKIPFKTNPKSVFLKHNASSRAEPVFVREAFDKLEYSGAVVEVPNIPKIVNPLTVSQRNGKFRLVLDL